VSILAIFLITVGVADLIRGARRPGRHAIGLLSVPVTVVVVAVLADLHTWPDVLLLVLCALSAAGWVVLSARALHTGRGELRPLAVLGVAILALLLLAGLSSPAGGMLDRFLQQSALQLEHVSATRALLVVGLFLVQISTGNEIVRLVLTSVGALKPHGHPQPSDRLRGGHLLGPLERMFILGLGLAGQVTAAGLVIAAKGLIRFPELNARRGSGSESGVGIDEVTEYFLVGSFLSWLVSLGALALTLLSP
jgi:hypothetical protein